MECANVFNVNKTYCTHLKVINNKLATRIVGNRSRPIFNPPLYTRPNKRTCVHHHSSRVRRTVQTLASSPIGQGCDLQTAIRSSPRCRSPPQTLPRILPGSFSARHAATSDLPVSVQALGDALHVELVETSVFSAHAHVRAAPVLIPVRAENFPHFELAAGW